MSKEMDLRVSLGLARIVVRSLEEAQACPESDHRRSLAVSSLKMFDTLRPQLDAVLRPGARTAETKAKDDELTNAISDCVEAAHAAGIADRERFGPTLAEQRRARPKDLNDFVREARETREECEARPATDEVRSAVEEAESALRQAGAIPSPAAVLGVALAASIVGLLVERFFDRR